MRILFALLMVLLMMPLGASAKKVQDTGKLFSVEVPDSWTYAPEYYDDEAGVFGGYYSGGDDDGAIIMLNSFNVKTSLDGWAQIAARQGPRPFAIKTYNDVLGTVPAKRLEWQDKSKGIDLVAIKWLVKKGNLGAAILLAYPRGSKANIKSIRDDLTRSFVWLK